jgi:PAS domain S-box-containing protein
MNKKSHIQLLSYLTLKQSSEPMIWIDSAGTIQHLNPAACRFYDLGYDDIVGIKIYELHSDENIDSWKKKYEKLKKHKRLSYEKSETNRDGQEKFIKITQNLIEYDGNEYIGCSLEDRSREYEMSNRIKESERKLKTLISNLPGMAYRCLYDENWTMEFVSDGCKKLTGYEPQDLIGNNKLAYSKIIIPEDQKKIREKIEEQIQKNSHFEISYRIKKPSGEIRWLWERGKGIPDEQGSIVAIEGLITDITRMKNTEKELIEKSEALRKLKNRLEEETIYLREEIKLNSNFEEIISGSDEFKKVLKKVEQVAATDSTVLIQGETGTGKELIARAIHNNSNRSERALVTINCAALPPEMIESELFGHEKGAYTGAYTKKVGRFELADQGTIFLDEIGDMPKNVQVKILRVLQEGEFERLGNSETIKTDVRIIAATNRNLDEAMQRGDFREDLYYRLNVFPIHVPPLRERKEDIPLLVQYFVKKYSKKTGRKIKETSKKVIDRLMAYDWPGNVRELENIIERAVIVCPGERLIKGEWLPDNSRLADSRICTLAENEKKHIIKALKSTNWQIGGDSGAANLLGMKRTTLQSRMKKLGITKPK